MQLWRYAIGRALIHLGLRVMPAGRVRSELYALIDVWASDVRRLLALQSAPCPSPDNERD